MNVWQHWQRFTAEASGPATGLSPAEQVALRWGEGATPLGGRWGALLECLPDVGRMRWRVENDLGSLEVAGSLDEVDATPRTAIGRGPGLELRLLLSRWAWAFAVDVEPHRGLRSSLRAFDDRGTELLRADLVADSDYLPYARMLSSFRNPDLSWTMAVEPPPRPGAYESRGVIATVAVLEAWSAMQTSGDFFRLLRTFELSRPAAYRQVEGAFARRLPASATGLLLEALAGAEVPLALRFASRGAILVHRGIVERVCTAGNALCVLDPGVRLELDLARAAECWLVRRPDACGERLSLELLDAQGDAIVTVRDARSDHEPSDPRWLAAAEAL